VFVLAVKFKYSKDCDLIECMKMTITAADVL